MLEKIINNETMRENETVIWVNPQKINGIERRGEIRYPNKNYEKSVYADASIWISKLKTYLDAGISIEKLLSINPIEKAVNVYFKDMVIVTMKEGQLFLGDNGRHRVKAAQDCLYCNNIPVCFHGTKEQLLQAKNNDSI